MNASDVLEGLNPNQRKIATTLATPLFVEAGAGSGKTSTLTKRVLWALTPGSMGTNTPYIQDLSQVLVITFTKAAAREIKERLRTALRNAGMYAHALQVDDAWISTIHGMCQRLLTQYAFEMGIDPLFRVASENEERHIFDEAFEEALTSCLEQDDLRDDMLSVQRIYGMKQSDDITQSFGISLSDIVKSLCERAQRLPHTFDDLTVMDARAYTDDMHTVVEFLQCLAAEIEASSSTQTKTMVNVQAALNKAQAYLSSWSDVVASDMVQAACALCDVYAALGRTPAKASYKALFCNTKRLLERLYCDYVLDGMRTPTRACIELAQRTYYAMRERLDAAHLLTQDLLILEARRLCIEHPDIAHGLSERFALVMVDEFQDTDHVQLELIRMLSHNGEHLACVGDAQQSIYRFRGADVDVFRRMSASIAPEHKVQLAQNYRSDPSVLALVEEVCNPSKQGEYPAGILDDFMPLQAGKDTSTTSEDTDSQSYPRLCVELVQGPPKAPFATTSAERVALRIEAYIRAGGSAGECAVLLGSTTHADVYIDAMRAHGIACVMSGGSGFSKTTEVQTIAHLLHVLANPLEEKQLFSLLTGAMFGLDDNDILLLTSMDIPSEDDRMPSKRPLRKGFESLDLPLGKQASLRLVRARKIILDARNMLAAHTPQEVCAYVVAQSGWIERLSSQGLEGQAQIANIYAGLRFVGDLCTSMGLGIRRAAQEFDLWLTTLKQTPFALTKDNSDFVQVMTIHASKGLEFPLVVLAEWNKTRFTNDTVCIADMLGSDVVFSGESQASLTNQDASPQTNVPVILRPSTTYLEKTFGHVKQIAFDPEKNFDVDADTDDVVDVLQRITTHMSDACAYTSLYNKAKDIQERARLLYVGLTRARERLIVVLPKKITKKQTSVSMADRVYEALFGEEDFSEGMHTVDIHAQFVSDATSHTREAFPLLLEVTNVGEDVCVTCEDEDVKAEGEEYGRDTAQMHVDDCVQEQVPIAFELPAHVGETNLALHFEPQSYGIYSYSRLSAYRKARTEMHAEMREETHIKNEVSAHAQLKQKPYIIRDTHATSFGTAFHRLAQTMVETSRYPSETRIEATCMRLGIRNHDRARLEEALACWFLSDIRRKCLTYQHMRAEVPFAVPCGSELGDVLEGAFDLICFNDECEDVLLIDYKTGDRDLSYEEAYQRHLMQAQLYYEALKAKGFLHISCDFVCVEVAGDPCTSCASSDTSSLSRQECSEAIHEPLVIEYIFEA